MSYSMDNKPSSVSHEMGSSNTRSGQLALFLTHQGQNVFTVRLHYPLTLSVFTVHLHYPLTLSVFTGHLYYPLTVPMQKHQALDSEQAEKLISPIVYILNKVHLLHTADIPLK